MKVSELRMGNVVLRPCVRAGAASFVADEIVGTGKDVLLFLTQGDTIVRSSSPCTGIELTDEWLKIMDFSVEYVKEGYIGYGGPFNQFILRKPSEEDPLYLWEYSEGGLDLVLYLYTVHEVQNLYFTLFKHELLFEYTKID